MSYTFESLVQTTILNFKVMKNLHLKHTAISAIIIQVIGLSAFVGSYFIPLMSNPDAQANLVLAISLIPASALGAHLYYRRGHQTHGFLLGLALFAVAIILDALITVPVFIIPNGGDHLSFFGDPGFWLIGVEYVSVVVIYWQIKKRMVSTKMRKA